MTPEPVAGAPSLKRVEHLRGLALRALPRMVTRSGFFGWCIRRGRSGDRLEGESLRYTAIVLIGLSAQKQDVSGRILGAGGSDACCDRLIDRLPRMNNIGDVALTLWAAVSLRRRNAAAALERLKALSPVERPCPTVELSWVVSALSFHPEFLTDEKLARAAAKRLKGAFHPDSALFSHHAPGTRAGFFREHVSCFADWVYPVQALSLYHEMTRDAEAAQSARASAAKMVSLQGPAGQWWWHYDVRTGRVVEPYPVYAVHQDGMAPMALLDLKDRCGADHTVAMMKGVDWLYEAPECGSRLVDDEAGLIWRKVARYEPNKWVRGMQAAASRMHPALRVPGTGVLFPARRIDWECRPYHLGWLLYAFSDRRVEAWGLGKAE